MDKAIYLDFIIEIIRRSESQKAFEVLPRLWVVERTFGWMPAGGASPVTASAVSMSPTPLSSSRAEIYYGETLTRVSKRNL
jgi:hypothetical protein